MKAAARNFSLALLLVLIVAQPVRAADESYSLLAHGNSQTLWVAEVKPTTSPEGNLRTVFRFRRSGDFANWTPMGEVAARVVQLSDRGNELIVLLDNGDWMLGSESGFRSGVPLPGHGKILSIAGDAETVWAIGEDLRPPPTTAPADAPTSQLAEAPATAPTSQSAEAPATAPTSQSAEAPATAPTSQSSAAATTGPIPLGLFHLVEGQWVYAGALSGDITPDDIQAMVLIDHRPLVAFAAPRHMVRVMSFAEDQWKSKTQIGPVPPGAVIDLLELQNRPIITVEDGSIISIFVRGAKWSPATRLKPTADVKKSPYHVVAAGLGQLRVLCSTDPRKLIEQAYNLNGSPAGPPFVATQPETIAIDKITYASIFVATVIFLAVMFGAMGRRTEIAEAAGRIEQLNLAPLGARFAAGVVDAIPLLLIPIFTQPTAATSDLATRLTVDQAIWLAIAMGIYVLHTAILEMVAGRSLGKMLFGMRVVGLDGNPASVWALLLRNVLRVIDVALLFPLALMLFLPLRQRLGDLAGGTLVVRDAEAGQAPEDH